MKLTIYDRGDESVGIFPRQFEIQCPFDKDDIEQSDLDFFKSEAELLFAEFDSASYSMYDFEYEEMIRKENELIENC